MEDYQIILNRDLQDFEKSSKVCVTGIIYDKWGNKNKFGIALKDITGKIIVSFGDNNQYTKEKFVKGKRVRIYASVILDRNEKKCLGNVKNVEFLEEINELNKELDIIEQETLVMMSKICNKIKNHLKKMGFIEVTTRVISRYLGEEILEPLLAEYPGFGTSAYLSPSPSSQLIEFLTVTLLPKVFTETISFTSSYRFENGSTETPIIMAKAINLSEEDEKNIIIRISNGIIDSLADKKMQITIINGEWKEELETNEKCKNGIFILGEYTANIPIIGQKWTSTVCTIRRLEDDRGNLLVEECTEKINTTTKISTFTFYPSQYLNWISKMPKRQLLNLWKVYEGGNIYG